MGNQPIPAADTTHTTHTHTRSAPIKQGGVHSPTAMAVVVAMAVMVEVAVEVGVVA